MSNLRTVGPIIMTEHGGCCVSVCVVLQTCNAMHLHLRVILEVPLLLKTAILSVCTPTTALDSSLILDSSSIVSWEPAQ